MLDITVVSTLLQHLQSTHEAIAMVINNLQALEFQIKAVYSTFILEMKVARHLLFSSRLAHHTGCDCSWCSDIRIRSRGQWWQPCIVSMSTRPFFIPAPNSNQFWSSQCRMLLGFTASFLSPPVVGCRLKMESSGHLWLLCLLLLWWVYCETISL